VLTILSYLGWKSSPISRLSDDDNTDHLFDDLEEWGVSTDYISSESSGSTPIIIHKISVNAAGEPVHSFSWRCPCCGAHLPGYKPVLANHALELSETLPSSQVFFFDRASRGTLHLAAACSEKGSLVVFEPSGIGDAKLLAEAWSLAHIVKYSHERLADITELDLDRRHGALLEIETHGEAGLRYRSRLPKCPTRGWKKVSATAPQKVVDAAGSGDWTTAGILDGLARGGLKVLKRTSPRKLADALQQAQALAAWNCGFEGARGGMYQVSKAVFRRQVETILNGMKVRTSSAAAKDERMVEALERLCPACKRSSNPPRKRVIL
jgi:fructokinase